MAQEKLVVIDTDVLIKLYRGDAIKKKQVEKLKGRVAISIITALELMQGVKSRKRLFELTKQLKAYHIIHLDTHVSELSLRLFKKYSFAHIVRVQDILIASTSIVHDYELFTDNKKDYEFVKEVLFYNP